MICQIQEGGGGGGGREEVCIEFQNIPPIRFLHPTPVSSVTGQGRLLSLVNLHYVVKDDFMPALTGDILVNISINDSNIFLLIFGPFMILFYNQLPNFITVFLTFCFYDMYSCHARTIKW